jgi:endoglucanase
LLLVIGGAIFAIVYFARERRQDRQGKADEMSMSQFERKRIQGGSIGKDGIEDLVDPVDGMIGNPMKYPPSECELPNYISKNYKIYAVSSKGEEVAVDIKGVNWFGMET